MSILDDLRKILEEPRREYQKPQLYLSGQQFVEGIRRGVFSLQDASFNILLSPEGYKFVMDSFLFQPWTEEQVAALAARQQREDLHPYTCGGGNRQDERHLNGEGVLVPTASGWVCPYCDYRQEWAFLQDAIPQ
ncbi:MAG: hypothetical protein KGL39_28865 [Patescibacteria group bacterium]|nr:hypothetical protein [Patescibacteria group bacterium]